MHVYYMVFHGMQITTEQKKSNLIIKKLKREHFK